MRRVRRGKRESHGSGTGIGRRSFVFFASASRFGASLSFSSASHHCVNAMTASGSPIRNPRCGTRSAEIALPQRQVVSGITVRSEERRVGKARKNRRSREQGKKKDRKNRRAGQR